MVLMQAIMATSFTVGAPFMPFFLTQLGVRSTADIALWAGAIASSGTLLLAFVSPYWGAYADRHGRKGTVLRCCIVPALCYLLFAASRQPWHIVAANALSGAFGGFSAAAMTLVGTQAPEGRLGFALGWMATGQLIGSLIGPLIGGLLADHLHDYRLIYILTAAGVLLGTLFTVPFVHERFDPPVGQRRTPLSEQIGNIVAHRTLLPLVVVLFLTQATIYAPIPILPLYVRSLIGNVPWLGTTSGLAIAIAGVAGALATPWLGRLGDRIGYRPVLIASLGAAALFTFPQALVADVRGLIALRFAAGLFLGGILPATNALIGRTASREDRGRIYGITSSASYFGIAAGPALGGAISAAFSFSTVFVLVAALTAVTLGLVLAMPDARAPLAEKS